MALESGVKIEGLDELVRTMKRAGVDVSELKEAHIRAAEIVATAAAQIAPRRSGRLADSIRPAKQVKRARIMAGGARVPYANPIHWGWPSRNIEASLFISNAAQSSEPQWKAAYLEAVQAALDKVHGA
jgi:hypothetical protein